MSSHFNDRVLLELLARGPVITDGMSDEEVISIVQGWEKELDSLIQKIPDLKLDPPTKQEL